MKQSFRDVLRGIRRATANTFRDTATTNVFVMLDRFHNAAPISVAYSTVRFRIRVQNNASNANHFFFYVLLTVHLSIILVINQLNAQNLVL